MASSGQLLRCDLSTLGIYPLEVTVRLGWELLTRIPVLAGFGDVAFRSSVSALVVAGCVDGLVLCPAATKCRTPDFARRAVVFFKQPETGSGRLCMVPSGLAADRHLVATEA